MSQNSMNIAAGSGAAVRAAINSAIQALASTSVGPSAPTTTYACMPWADTTAGRLRRRSSDNLSWIDCGALDIGLGNQLQSQSGTAFTAGGTAPAYTLTPSPAITAYASGQRFRVAFTAAGTTGSNTINVSGLGAKQLMQYGSNGSLVPAIITAGLLSDVEYNGTYAVVLDPIPSSGPFGFRNKLINAAGNINQRGYTSGTATTVANQYTIDRWKVVTLGKSLSWVTNGAGVTFTAPAGGVIQIIEAGNIEGGTYVLSWTGTATAIVNGTAVTNGGTIVIAANTQTTVTFSGGTFAFPQLELGSAPTTFDWRPLQVELALCQRYFERLAITGTGPAYGIGGVASGVAYITVQFQTKKRSNPSVSFSALNTFYVWSFSTGNINPTAMPATVSTTTSVGVNATISSGSPGQVAALEDAGSGTSWIAIDADI